MTVIVMVQITDILSVLSYEMIDWILGVLPATAASHLRHEALSRFFEMELSTPEVDLKSGQKDPQILFR